jgi:hypothetical protein
MSAADNVMFMSHITTLAQVRSAIASSANPGNRTTRIWYFGPAAISPNKNSGVVSHIWRKSIHSGKAGITGAADDEGAPFFF